MQAQSVPQPKRTFIKVLIIWSQQHMFILRLVLFPRAVSVRQQQSVHWICAGLITAQRWTSALLQALPQLKQQQETGSNETSRDEFDVNDVDVQYYTFSSALSRPPSPSQPSFSETLWNRDTVLGSIATWGLENYWSAPEHFTLLRSQKQSLITWGEKLMHLQMKTMHELLQLKAAEIVLFWIYVIHGTFHLFTSKQIKIKD